MASESAAVAAATSPSLILTSGASGRVNVLSARVLRCLVMLIKAIVVLLLLPFRGRKRTNSVAEKLRDDKQEGSCGGGRKGGAVVRLPVVSWKKIAGMAVDQEVAARRSLAIKRVALDNDINCIREYSLFSTPRGDTIFTQSWTPVSRKKIRGLVFLMHGLNEHSGRYSDFAKQLTANGYKVYGMDWTGHGGTDGLHAYVHSLDDAVADMKLVLDKVLAENPGIQCFCFGHSTGAAIVLKAVLDPKVGVRVAGLVLTSPAVGVQPSHPIFVVLAPIFSFFLPRYQFSAANKKGVAVSRDPEALLAKYSDPLVYTGSIRVRTGYEILCITSYLQKNLSRLETPFLVLHGEADAVTDPAASAKMYEEASSTDKTLKLYEGLLHDLLFEPEREDITKDIIKWLNNRTEI